MRILLLGLLLLPVSLAYGEKSGHPVTLWEIEGDSNSIFLLGSIHLLREQDYPLPSIVDTVYREAEVLIMEVDMDDLNPFVAQSAFTTYGMLQDGQTLADVMGADMYARAEQAAAAIDIPLDLLHKTEPWYAAMTVEIMMLSRIGFDPQLGIEMHLTGKATSDGKPINGLETIEQQVRFLDSMSLPAQREMLLSTLTESARMGELMDELINAWRHGDVDFLANNLLSEFAEHEELLDTLVINRNQRWVKEISELADDTEDYLIVVGALHLVGEAGVPQQLRLKGFDVRQLSEPPPVR